MAKLKTGLIEIYTGDGKGKSTASFGLAIRAAGRDLAVRIVQFMKTGDYGENRSLDRLSPQIEYAAFGHKGFLDPNDPQPEDIALAHEALAKAREFMAVADLLILDEINNALFFKLLTIDEVLAFLDEKPAETELVLTGRNAPPELIARADYVTEMCARKHPFTSDGIAARKGIEF